LIVRDQLLSDRRVFLLQATLAGRQLCKKAINAVNAHEEKLFVNIDGEMRKSIVKTMQHIQSRGLESTS